MKNAYNRAFKFGITNTMIRAFCDGISSYGYTPDGGSYAVGFQKNGTYTVFETSPGRKVRAWHFSNQSVARAFVARLRK